MMSLETIRSMSRAAARKAAREKNYPFFPEAEDFERGLDLCRCIPFIGWWKPRGYKRLGDAYMVDSSGFGSEGEPALTIPAFVRRVRENGRGVGYAIVEAGQFQIVIQEFTRSASVLRD